MPGVRIRHIDPEERNSSFTLVDSSRPYTEPWTCPAPPLGCGSTHIFKAYHFKLDETASTIVSTQIAESLKRMHAPFVVTNEVAEPPAQTIRVPAIVVRPRAISPGVPSVH